HRAGGRCATRSRSAPRRCARDRRAARREPPPPPAGERRRASPPGRRPPPDPSRERKKRSYPEIACDLRGVGPRCVSPSREDAAFAVGLLEAVEGEGVAAGPPVVAGLRGELAHVAVGVRHLALEAVEDVLVLPALRALVLQPLEVGDD